ncbi:uncharacterized protein JCM15063_000544 [Sporobolomyces koalae]|uniref:uncharacterized protein n=1 Tax=Sporobolomyces koalae TaxID=500713 RepID=UPI0031816573
MDDRRSFEGSHEGLLNEGEAAMEAVRELHRDRRKRHAMLACACLLGLGSHFGAYVLGPIKSSLKTSESGFAAFIASFELLNTITPLLSGFLVPRFGAAKVGLVATGTVLAGQIIVCLSQDDGHQHRLNMTGTIGGLLLFGAGISPVSVVQETIILSNNTSKSSSVGRSVALGLVLGKTSSFLAGASSDWLHSISPRLPFVVASGFAVTSFIACLVYSRTERSISRSASNATAVSGHGHGPINLRSYAKFGDPFWLYISICFGAGLWYTTIHLSTNLLELVYEVKQHQASQAASVLLLSPTFLYPLAGWALDKRPPLLSLLYLAVPVGLASSLSALLFLPAVVPYTIALLGAALCCGVGPLLSVLVVPRIVSREQVSPALALHKSLEMSGAIVFQTISGYLLAHSISGGQTREDPNSTLTFLLIGALVQLGLVGMFLRLLAKRSCGELHQDGQKPIGDEVTRQRSLRMRVSTECLRNSDMQEEQYGLLSEPEEEEDGDDRDIEDEETIGPDEVKRGKNALVVAGTAVVGSWAFFLSNLVKRA